MRITLTVTEGPHRGRVFSFDRHDTFIVGRSPDVHFPLPDDPYFSRVHFLVEVNPPLCRLQDLGSHNGTRVNDREVTAPTDLRHGDQIRGGQTVLRVAFEAPTVPSPAPGSGQRTLTLSPTDTPLGDLPARAQGLIGDALADLVCDDQERRAAAGRSVPAEMYLQLLPPLRDNSTAAVDVIYNEYRLRRRRGERPEAEEYLRRFAAYANRIARQLQLDAFASELCQEGLPDSSLLTGTPGSLPLPSLPGYRIVREVGRGGMGVVYEALADDGGRVAVKTVLPAVRPNTTEVERFLREADILRRLEHPNVVRFLAAGQTGSLFFFVMEFVEGANASHLVRELGPQPTARAVGWAAQLLEALTCAHAGGFVHRDIKPGNLLVTPDDRVKLADFGLARAYQDSPMSGLTLTGAVGGTPEFMAPEQVLNFRRVGPAADQYAAAATLYYLLTGQRLHDAAGRPATLFKLILQSDPVPLRTRRPDVPEGLAAAVHRALARRPEDRFPDANSFRLALLPYS
jgi:eukaryotic-like serine/threonine-protein kinase